MNCSAHRPTRRHRARSQWLNVAFVVAASQAGTVWGAVADPPNSSMGLEEIVVTATRREERLQDIPVSATAFTQEKLDAQGLRNIDDLARLTPGVTFQRNGTTSSGNFNDEDSNVNIRGVDSTAGASTIGVYVDDTPIQARHITFTSFSAFPELFDLERVEVLRGPQGTLFGAGAEGGAVRFITPTPALDRYSAYVRSEYSSTLHGDPSYELGAAAGGPIVNGRLGFRLSANVRNDGGWVDRADYRSGATTESSANWRQAVTIRGALKWEVSDDVSITPSLYYQELKLHDTSAYWPELSNPGSGHFVNGNAQRNPSVDPFYLAAIRVDWKLGFGQLTSNTSYFSRHQHSISDYTQFDRSLFALTSVGPRPPPGDLGTSHDADTQNNFYQEVRLQSLDAAAAVTWTTGVFYAHLNEDTTEQVFDPNLDAEFNAFYGTPLCTPQAPCPGGNILSQPVSRIIDTQYAIFGDVTVKLAKSWRATVGARFARVEYNGDLVYFGPFLSPTNGPLTPLVGLGSSKETPITPKLVLSYQPDGRNLFYASMAKGYRVGGINGAVSSLCGPNLSSIGITNPPQNYDSDSLWSYELGAKHTSLDGRLQINSSLFTIDWQRIQQAVYLTGCGQNFVENLGAVRSVGGDVDVQIRPTAAMQMGVSVAYVDAKYTRTVCAGPTLCTGPLATAAPVVTAGDRLPGAPWTVLASLEYDWGSLRGARPYVRMDYQMTTAQSAKQPIQDPNNGVSDTTYAGLPQVKTLGARAGLRRNGFDVSLFAQNLTDSHPLLSQTRDTNASDLYFAHTARPRTIGLTATYHY